MIFGLERQPGGRTALRQEADGRVVPYGELADLVSRAGRGVRDLAGGDAPLTFLLAANDVEGVALYLACLDAQVPVAMVEPGRREAAARLIEAYGPRLVLAPAAEPGPEGYADAGVPAPCGGYRAWLLTAEAGAPSCHPELALLLTTSGSTGSPKLVRLRGENVAANAESIGSYLGLGPDEHAIQSLPIHYSYGLSILNSHLAAGASVMLTSHSFIRPEFWAAFAAGQCTSFAGIPYMYETLARMRFQPARHATLRTMTQAGGALSAELTRQFHESAHAAGIRLFIMYGQTEATARIAYVPPERLPAKFGSIGLAIPGGKLWTAPVEGDAELQELMYSGPNVMMGYAEGPADLAMGDQLQGVLRTGDLARSDDDGFFYLTGRLKRIAKLFGRRVSLEDLESDLERRYPLLRAAAVERAGGIMVFVEPPAGGAGTEPAEIAKSLAARLNVPPKSVQVETIANLPRTSNGKKDYKALPA